MYELNYICGKITEIPNTFTQVYSFFLLGSTFFSLKNNNNKTLGKIGRDTLVIIAFILFSNKTNKKLQMRHLKKTRKHDSVSLAKRKIKKKYEDIRLRTRLGVLHDRHSIWSNEFLFWLMTVTVILKKFGSIVVGEMKLILAQILSTYEHIHKLFWSLFLNNA